MAARRRAMLRWLRMETAAISAPRNAMAAVTICARSPAFDIIIIVLWSPLSAVAGATLSDLLSIAVLSAKADESERRVAGAGIETGKVDYPYKASTERFDADRVSRLRSQFVFGGEARLDEHGRQGHARPAALGPAGGRRDPACGNCHAGAGPVPRRSGVRSRKPQGRARSSQLP